MNPQFEIRSLSDPQDRCLAQFAQGYGWIRRAKDCRTRDDYLGSGADDLGYIVPIDAAVDLDPGLQSTFVNHFSQATNFVERSWNKLLTAKARINRHQQDVVGKLDRFVQSRQRRGRIDRNTRLCSRGPYCRQ